MTGRLLVLVVLACGACGTGTSTSADAGETLVLNGSSSGSSTSGSGGGTSSTSSTSSGGGSSGGALDVAIARRAYLGATAAYEIPVTASVLVVEAVYTASYLGANGQSLVTTGTLTQSGNGQVTYSATPGDKLRVEYNNNVTVEYTINEINGNFTLDSNAFFTEDYTLRFRYANAALADVDVVGTRTGGNQQGSVAGTMILENVTYQANCTRQGTVSSQVGSGFTRIDSADTLSGTITTDGFSLTVNEQVVTGYQLSNGQTANDISRTINNTWTNQGVAYALNGAVIRKSFVDGVAAQLDSSWRAEGPLTRGGTQIGGLGWGQDAVQARIWIDVGSERTVLESHPVPQQ
ncbi:MAG: hypothetical protein AB2A00_33865 [Myxococcota bacterium]